MYSTGSFDHRLKKTFQSKKSFTQATLVFGSLQLAHQEGADA